MLMSWDDGGADGLAVDSVCAPSHCVGDALRIASVHDAVHVDGQRQVVRQRAPTESVTRLRRPREVRTCRTHASDVSAGGMYSFVNVAVRAV